jgi:NAD(P)-dependent dehydrogenase (short-subunit alcohol dehydrogenase family)
MNHHGSAAHRDPAGMHVLVVGARRGSIGWHVTECLDDVGVEVLTAGLHQEDVPLDLRDDNDIRRVLSVEQPTDIVCTAGINIEHAMRSFSPSLLTQELDVNAVLPLSLLSWWLKEHDFAGSERPGAGHFVAISSNSASIARSQSLGYCASKAALSMGIRCAARDVAGNPAIIYAYEPGWVNGTPMSEAVSERLSEDIPPHRIPGGRGVAPATLGWHIARNILYGGHELNGTTIRLDGGEQ